MKVIGKIDPEHYICTVEHWEIEKFRNLYFNNMTKLDVGSEFDLSKGYAFHEEVKDMLSKTEAFLSSSKKIIKTITDGISFLGSTEEDETNEDNPNRCYGERRY